MSDFNADSGSLSAFEGVGAAHSNAVSACQSITSPHCLVATARSEMAAAHQDVIAAHQEVVSAR